MTTCSSDATALQQYVKRMQTVLDQMRSMAGPMDSYMMRSGKPLAGDMACGVQVMSEQLAQSVACTGSKMASNYAEATRRSDALESFADHMEMSRSRPAP